METLQTPTELTLAQRYGQSIFEHYGNSHHLASEKLDKYIPYDEHGHIDADRIDEICRSTQLGTQLVELLRGSDDPVGEDLLTDYAVGLMFHEYMEFTDVGQEQ